MVRLELRDRSRIVKDIVSFLFIPFLYIAAIKSAISASERELFTISVIIPVTSGLEDTGKIKEHYFDLVINRLEKITQQAIRKYIVFKR